jgi:ubiquinone biosynthesis protein Coq4
MDDQQREAFEAFSAGRGVDVTQLGDRADAFAVAARTGDLDATRSLAAMFTYVAATCPAHLVAVYDGAACGWFGATVDGPAVDEPTLAPTPPDGGFWQAFWELVLDPMAGSDAADITVRTAALTSLLAPELRTCVATVAREYPGVNAAAASGYPAPFTLAALAACPRGSLGSELHDLVVVNGFDLEVLDRAALNLDLLPAPLDYLNARIMQCHDVWHKVAGYETTVLHEVAISGFQMAQFGHHYSSLFLAVTITKVGIDQPIAVPLILDTVLSAWVHGRTTPPMLGVPWEQIWHLPIAEIREQLSIRAYPSPHPADLIEQLRAA